jgi:predicted anti-sigma-YlaC factor YlaD
VKNLLARLTPPCHDVARLASESLDRRLPLLTKLRVRLHLLICAGCRHYAAQLRALRETLLSRSGKGPENDVPPSDLSEEAKARLRRSFTSRRE